MLESQKDWALCVSPLPPTADLCWRHANPTSTKCVYTCHTHNCHNTKTLTSNAPSHDSTAKPARNCGAMLYDIHPDWEWVAADFKGLYSKPLNGITWAGTRQLAFMRDVFPDLDGHIAQFHACTGNHGLQKCIDLSFNSGHHMETVVDDHGTITSVIMLGAHRLDITSLPQTLRARF